MTIFDFSNSLSGGGMDELFSRIYRKSDMQRLRQRARYLNAAENFSKLYPNREDIYVFSAPACEKICGNYTANHGGSELIATVTTDIIAIVSYHDEGVIRIKSDNRDKIEIDIVDLSDSAEKSCEILDIVRKNIAYFAEQGIICDGFDAYIASDIPEKKGFSSSETLDILIAEIVKSCSSKSSSELLVAKFEGIFEIDMKKPQNPIIHKIDFDFSESGYSLCIIDSEGEFNFESEMDADMKSVANAIGVDYLGEADEDKFYDNLSIVRGKCTDRAVMSAIRFFEENRLVRLQREALDNGKLNEFFNLVNESGDSSALFHNLYGTDNFGILVGIAASKRFLNGSGAVRIDENGRIQAFVPNYMVNGFIGELDRIFGQGSVLAIGIRSDGTIKIFG